MSETIKRTEARPTRGESRAERPQRVPINGDRDILAVHGIRPGYHPCWVAEKNVNSYINAGYEFVKNEGVTFGSHHVQQGNPLGARYSRDGGGGIYLYLMEILQEWYDEDRAKEMAELDKAMEGLNSQAREQGLDQGKLTITRS